MELPTLRFPPLLLTSRVSAHHTSHPTQPSSLDAHQLLSQRPPPLPTLEPSPLPQSSQLPPLTFSQPSLCHVSRLLVCLPAMSSHPPPPPAFSQPLLPFLKLSSPPQLEQQLLHHPLLLAPQPPSLPPPMCQLPQLSHPRHLPTTALSRPPHQALLWYPTVDPEPVSQSAASSLSSSPPSLCKRRFRSNKVIEGYHLKSSDSLYTRRICIWGAFTIRYHDCFLAHWRNKKLCFESRFGTCPVSRP